MNPNKEDNTIAQHARPEVSETFELDNGNTVTFRIVKWAPSKVFDRIPEYGSVIGVPLVMYSTTEYASDDTLTEKIGMALIQLFSGLEQRVLSKFLKDILDEVYTEKGISVVEKFDEMFLLHPYLVVELAAKVLEVNYGPFFKRGFGKLLTQLQAVKTLNDK